MDKRKPRLVYDEKDARPGDMIAAKAIHNVEIPQPTRFKIVVELDDEVIYCAPYALGETHEFPKGLPTGEWSIKLLPYGEHPKGFKVTG